MNDLNGHKAITKAEHSRGIEKQESVGSQRNAVHFHLKTTADISPVALELYVLWRRGLRVVKTCEAFCMVPPECSSLQFQLDRQSVRMTEA